MVKISKLLLISLLLALGSGILSCGEPAELSDDDMSDDDNNDDNADDESDDDSGDDDDSDDDDNDDDDNNDEDTDSESDTGSDSDDEDTDEDDTDDFDTDDLPDIAFDTYHDLDEIAQYLRDVEQAAPGITRFEVLGESGQGREIAYLVIDTTDVDDPPAIHLNGAHHGDEKPSTETILYTIDHVLKNLDAPQVSEIVSEFALYMVPVVNPDGHEANTRGNASGTDLNRDYNFPENDGLFREPETKLQKQLIDEVGFAAAAAYHTGIEVVLWPWCYTGDQTDDHDVFYTISKASADAMGMSCMQSYDDYATQGEFIDYAYWKHGTLAITIEVSRQKQPDGSQLPPILERALDGTLAFMKAVVDNRNGTLKVEKDKYDRPAGRLTPVTKDGYKLE